MKITSFLTASALVAAAACGSSATAPSSTTSATTLGRHIETAAYEYRFAASDSVDVTWQESYHVWAIGALGVSLPRRIVYNKYFDRQHMGTQTGNANTNAFANAERFEIHTIWSRDNHEVVHLYSSLWGRPVALWTEGLAVAYQVDPPAQDYIPRWSRIPLDDHARRFLAEGRLIPLDDLLTTSDFRRFDSNVTYPEAGSFMRHVIETCGLDAVKRLYATGRTDDNAAAVREQVQAACGRSLADLEAAWRQRLAG